MPTARYLTILMLLAAATGLSQSGLALGSVESPLADGQGTIIHPVPSAPAVVPQADSADIGGGRRITSYYQEIQSEVFSKLRPVDRGEPIDFNSAASLLNNKTINEQIFNKDFETKMRGQYAGKVAPYEKTATNPIWRASSYEMQQYDSGRHDLAQWTTREVMDDQLKDFFNHSDKNSSAMQAISTARSLTGGGDDKPPETLTPEEKEARSHRTDLPVATPVADQDAPAPTNIKTKMNLLKQNGSVVFSNPVAITSVNGSRDDVSMHMTREFRRLALKTNAHYAMKDGSLNVNVSKQVVDHVSLDLDHYNYTGATLGPSGERVRDQAKVNYSLSF